jgi:hypothetical protein
MPSQVQNRRDLLAIIYVFVGIFLLFASDDLAHYATSQFTRSFDPAPVRLFILITGTLTAAIGATILFTRYLNGAWLAEAMRHDTQAPTSPEAREPRPTEQADTKGTAAVQDSTAPIPNEDLSLVLNKDDEIEKMRELVIRSIPDRVLVNLESRFAAKLYQNAHAGRVRLNLHSAQIATERAIAASSRRNNLNLAVGVVITLIAATGLGYVSIFESKPDPSNLIQVISHYIPRISTIAFIEIFAFFFLRLYRSGLRENRYLQNERTNILLQTSAFDAALHDVRSPALADLIGQLARTDRNKQSIAIEEGTSAVDIKTLGTFVDAVAKLTGKN